MKQEMYFLKYHLLLTSPKSSFIASYFRSKVPYIILIDSLGPPSTFKISCRFIGIRYHKIIMKYLVLSPHLDHLFSVLLKKSGQNMINCQRINFLKTNTERQKAQSTSEQGFGDFFCEMDIFFTKKEIFRKNRREKKNKKQKFFIFHLLERGRLTSHDAFIYPFSKDH